MRIDLREQVATKAVLNFLSSKNKILTSTSKSWPRVTTPRQRTTSHRPHHVHQMNFRQIRNGCSGGANADAFPETSDQLEFGPPKNRKRPQFVLFTLLLVLLMTDVRGVIFLNWTDVPIEMFHF